MVCVKSAHHGLKDNILLQLWHLSDSLITSFHFLITQSDYVVRYLGLLSICEISTFFSFQHSCAFSLGTSLLFFVLRSFLTLVLLLIYSQCIGAIHVPFGRASKICGCMVPRHCAFGGRIYSWCHNIINLISFKASFQQFCLR